MLARFIHIFWPDLEKEEIKKFGMLASMFFLIIGSYWLLRLLKNIILYKIAFPVEFGWPADQGRLMQPVAKQISLIVMFAVVFIYSKLVDLFEKHKLFYILCSFYVFLFSIITALLAARHFMGDAFLGKTALAGLGWATFLTVESFGSLIVALFWSFTSSITNTDSAKKGYPMLAAAAQFGAVIGSIPLIFSEQIGGVWRLFFGVTIAVAMVIFLMYRFMKIMPKDQLVGNKKAAATEKKKDSFFWGFFSGFWLLISRPYLLGVLIVSTFYETINQIIEYQMQSAAYIYPSFSTEHGFAYFQGIYGLCVNILSFLVALLGTSYLIKRFGLRTCLLIFPICLAIAFMALFIFFQIGSPSPSQMLWASFGVMIIAKGLGYAINNPTKEVMYIPTSKDVKFKAKGWIDMMGSRTAKGGGSAVTHAFKYNISELMVYGTFISLGLTSIWIIAALFVGTMNRKLIKENRIVE